MEWYTSVLYFCEFLETFFCYFFQLFLCHSFVDGIIMVNFLMGVFKEIYYLLIQQNIYYNFHGICLLHLHQINIVYSFMYSRVQSRDKSNFIFDSG